MEIGVRRLRDIWFFSVLLVLFSPVIGDGVARAEGMEVLGLEQLIPMALERSPEMKEVEQDIRAAESDFAQARAGQWAQMEVIAMTGPSQNAKNPSVVVDAKPRNGKLYGSIVENDEDNVGIFGRLDILIMQPLYTFGKISNRQQAAAAGVEVQKAGREKKRSEVIRNVKELYYALIVANQGKDAAQDTDGFIQDARRRITALLSHGASNVDQSDLYRLEAFEADVQQFKVKADAGARMAYMALKKAVGYPESKDFKLDKTELPKTIQPLGDQEGYIRKALDRRPEFTQLKKGLEAQKSMVEAARADLYPSVFAAGVGSFAGAPEREYFENSYFRDDFNHVEGGIILGTEWRFDLGIGKARVNKAKAEYQKLVHTREFAERNIPLEVAKYYQDIVEAQSGFQSYGKAAAAARRWIVSAFSNFDMGVGTAKDIFDAIDRYGKNQGEYLRALYDYHVALAGLNYAVHGEE